MKKTFLLPAVATLAICLVVTSCSQAVTEEATAPLTEESVTETTAEPFDPILISDDYHGPILGIENWHIETGKMSFGGWTICSYHFVEDDTGIEFAYYAGYEDDVTAYLADLDGDGDDPTSFDQVLEVLPSGDLVVIEGADHLFEGEYGEMMVEDVCEKIASWNY